MQPSVGGGLIPLRPSAWSQSSCLRELTDCVRSPARIAADAQARMDDYISFVRMIRCVARGARVVRFLAAGAVIFSVLLARFESLLPDVHDRTSIASAQAVSDPGIAARQASAERASRPLGTSPNRTNGHPCRVDHCTHSHYLTLAIRLAATIGENHTPTLGTSSPELVSVLSSPHHRPPIA